MQAGRRAIGNGESGDGARREGHRKTVGTRRAGVAGGERALGAERRVVVDDGGLQVNPLVVSDVSRDGTGIQHEAVICIFGGTDIDRENIKQVAFAEGAGLEPTVGKDVIAIDIVHINRPGFEQAGGHSPHDAAAQFVFLAGVVPPHEAIHAPVGAVPKRTDAGFELVEVIEQVM